MLVWSPCPFGVYTFRLRQGSQETALFFGWRLVGGMMLLTSWMKLLSTKMRSFPGPSPVHQWMVLVASATTCVEKMGGGGGYGPIRASLKFVTAETLHKYRLEKQPVKSLEQFISPIVIRYLANHGKVFSHPRIIDARSYLLVLLWNHEVHPTLQVPKSLFVFI